jgi:hypothetical protein
LAHHGHGLHRSQTEVELAQTWQTLKALIAMVNHIEADSEIPPKSQTFKDLI